MTQWWKECEIFGVSKAWRPNLDENLAGFHTCWFHIIFLFWKPGYLHVSTSPCVKQAQRQVAFEQARLLLSPGSHAVVQPLKPRGRFLQMIIQLLGRQ